MAFKISILFLDIMVQLEIHTIPTIFLVVVLMDQQQQWLQVRLVLQMKILRMEWKNQAKLQQHFKFLFRLGGWGKMMEKIILFNGIFS